VLSCGGSHHYQLFNFSAITGLIRSWSDPGLCITGVDGCSGDGSLCMQKCRQGAASQTWQYVVKTMALSLQGSNSSSGIGGCLTEMRPAGDLTVEPCLHASTAQQWSFGNPVPVPGPTVANVTVNGSSANLR